MVIAGTVTMDLWASTDGPDTDFVVKLVDVYPDGYEAIILDSAIRTRYRNGRMPDQIEMMTPGAPEKLTIDLWDTALTFEKGHRIAVHVTSSNSPRIDVNPNTGDNPGPGREDARGAQHDLHGRAAAERDPAADPVPAGIGCAMAGERAFDVIVYGATGFTGRLVAEHMLATYGVGRDVRWAMAGRSKSKLESVRSEIGAPAELPLVIADASDAGVGGGDGEVRRRW